MTSVNATELDADAIAKAGAAFLVELLLSDNASAGRLSVDRAHTPSDS
jgi:hypothetical protein